MPEQSGLVRVWYHLVGVSLAAPFSEYWANVDKELRMMMRFASTVPLDGLVVAFAGVCCVEVLCYPPDLCRLTLSKASVVDVT